MGFTLGQPVDWQEHYAAGLEGVALLERAAYEMLAQLGLEVGPRVFITGGAARSLLWSRIRASALDRQLLKPLVPEAAMGAALLAAAGCWYPTLRQAVAEMVKISQAVEPEPAWRPVYAERYAAFVAELTRRGYLG